MIMPAHPRVGDVYRTENVPGLVFEQVTVKKVGVTVSGPTGPVPGAMVAQELHMDERRLEDKTFAPGYGEFFSGGGRTFEATSLAIPADALSEPAPPALHTLSTSAISLLDATGSRDWTAASAGISRMNAAFSTLQSGEVPERLYAQMNNALDSLKEAVRTRRARKGSLAALDVAQANLDLELRYRPPAEIDLARFDLWTRRLEVDANAGDTAAVRGDVATLGWIRDRVPLATSDANRIDDQLRFLDAAAQAGQLQPAADAAARLRETVPVLTAAEG